MSAGEIAGITVEAALEQVRIAFAERTMPVGASYCHCDACSDEHDSRERILHSVPVDLSDDDLEMLLRTAYWTGLNWPALSYYIPEMMTRVKLYGTMEAGMLLYKLMLATRPDLIMTSGGSVSNFIDESMNPAERESIFSYVQAIFDIRLHTLPYQDNEDEFHEILAFLINFDSPIAPLLERWKQTDDLQARVNLCLFVTDYLLHYSDGRRFITGTYYDRDTAPLPENQAALDALLAPETAANLLMECAESVETVGPEWQTGIGAAFDWAMTLARRER